MRTRSTLLAAATASLLAAAPALADRAGDGPVDAPRTLSTVHSEFTLPGDGWAQSLREGGAPRIGLYVLEVPMPVADTCRLYASVRATSFKRPPQVGRRSVVLHTVPGGRDVLRIDERGGHGAIRWWISKRQADGPEGLAVQQMPAKLRTERRRWLVYRFEVGHGAAPAAEDACAERARRTGGRTVRSIARTLRLADGPAVSEPPFAPIG
ncbi:MAG: hypothetical protein QOI73_3360 [Solirubrobacteraceae bacterium]|nr:hypothetical protein [Solirubrobacteraceae bacterium]